MIINSTHIALVDTSYSVTEFFLFLTLSLLCFSMNDCLVEKVAGLEERVVGLEAGGRRAVREAGEGMTMGLEENDLGITP